MTAFSSRSFAIGACVIAALLASGCSRGSGELVVDDSVGVTALRSPCRDPQDVGALDGRVAMHRPVALDWQVDLMEEMGGAR